MKPSEHLTDAYVEMVGQLFDGVCNDNEKAMDHIVSAEYRGYSE